MTFPPFLKPTSSDSENPKYSYLYRNARFFSPVSFQTPKKEEYSRLSI